MQGLVVATAFICIMILIFNGVSLTKACTDEIMKSPYKIFGVFIGTALISIGIVGAVEVLRLLILY